MKNIILREGLVSWISLKTCTVLSEDGAYECLIKKVLLEDRKNTLSVGDRVRFSSSAPKTGRVEELLIRKTVFARLDPDKKSLRLVMAANADQVCVTVSMKDPPLRLKFIDRCIVAAKMGGMESLIVVNKTDLADPAEREDAAKLLGAYREIGLKVVFASAHTGEGLPELRRSLEKKTSVLAGHSGVGKSSLLNAIDPGLRLKTGSVNTKTGKGNHTTSASRMYALSGDIRIIDAPGVREFDLGPLGPGEISAGFPEFSGPAEECRFSSCTHVTEPDCGVKRAVREGRIPRARYASYLRLLDAEGKNGDDPLGPGSGEGSFTCIRCRASVPAAAPGTEHRNHCPRCLWSRHADHLPGDRASCCDGAMEPIGVWVRSREWVIIHRCTVCGTIHANRVAGDDNEALLLSLAVKPLANPPFALDRIGGNEC